jgi:hypothetical protein
MSVFEHDLKNCLADYHARNMRYRHLAFSSKDVSELENTKLVLKNILSDYTVWDGFYPDEKSPPANCSRSDFIRQTFNSHTQDLIIYQPDYWMRHWSIQDKQAFWSALSTRHGGHNVVVVFAENHEFHSQNNHYLLPHALPNTTLNYWVSSKIPLTR